MISQINNLQTYFLKLKTLKINDKFDQLFAENGILSRNIEKFAVTLRNILQYIKSPSNESALNINVVELVTNSNPLIQKFATVILGQLALMPIKGEKLFSTYGEFKLMRTLAETVNQVTVLVDLRQASTGEVPVNYVFEKNLSDTNTYSFNENSYILEKNITCSEGKVKIFVLE